MQPELGNLVVSFGRVAHSIVCCRILLNIRRAASPRGPLTILRSIGLQFATALEQETDQAETIRLETDLARDGEENPREQVDEDFVAGCNS